jgi:aminobenzoyl-glutamate utilization protein B
VARRGFFVVVLSAALAAPAYSGDPSPDLEAAIRQLAQPGWTKAQEIWDWAEPGYQERASASLLSNWLESAGFRVQRGVAGMPTAFVAEFGKGAPCVALLGEYDALPGLSQEGTPHREPRPGGKYGHGCGHHLLGVASAMAAMAVADQIRQGKLPGTIRYYGCPAEEGGSAKAFMVRDGLFRDADAVLHWHPSSMNTAGDRSSLARIAVRFRFHGTSAHAAGAPEQGRSALDAVELTNFGAQLLREHIPQDARMHYVITNGGDAPNIVPHLAETYYYIRHPSSEVVRGLYERLLKCAQAGALATETRLEVIREGGILELLPNTALGEIVRARLERMNDLHYSAEESEFALKLQHTLAEPKPLESIRTVAPQGGELGRGSTDVGDVSWTVPTAGVNVACWVPGTPGHSWQAVACGNTTIARQGMVLAARVLASSASELLTSPEVVQRAQEELQRRLGERAYQPLIEADQKPPLDYRRTPQRGE